jgi:hypothetical protein
MWNVCNKIAIERKLMIKRANIDYIDYKTLSLIQLTFNDVFIDSINQ